MGDGTMSFQFIIETHSPIGPPARRPRQLQTAMKQDNYYSVATEPVSMEFARPEKRPLLTELEETVCSAYKDAKEFISSLDKSIVKCKKYNEDKSYRKYETYIRDLENTNRQLKATIQILQQTISPTKLYMMDLLDKVVQAKRQRQRLNREINCLKDELKLKQTEIQQYRMDMTKFQRVIKANKIDKLPPIQQNPSNLEDALRAYLKQKQKIRTKLFLPPSLLEQFIIQNRKKLWSWSLSFLLEQLGKYMETVERPKETEDLWRAQFRASQEFNKLIKSTKPPRTSSTKRSLKSVKKSFRRKQLFNTSVNEVC